MPYEVPYILLQIQIQTACVNTVSEVWHKTSPFPLHYITVEEETGKENAITQQNMKNRLRTLPTAGAGRLPKDFCRVKTTIKPANIITKHAAKVKRSSRLFGGVRACNGYYPCREK